MDVSVLPVIEVFQISEEHLPICDGVDMVVRPLRKKMCYGEWDSLTMPGELPLLAPCQSAGDASRIHDIAHQDISKLKELIRLTAQVKRSS